MTAYSDDQEKAIRVGRLVHDWTNSGLLTAAQRAQIAPELEVDLRRTNRFLRITLFIFGLLILQSMVGLLIIGMGGEEAAGFVLCASAAAASFFAANMLATRFKLYRFGIEEAAAVASIILAGAAGALLVTIFTDRISDSDAVVLVALIAGAAASVAVFLRFGLVYAAIIAMVLAACIPFVPGDSDMWHRVVSAAALVAIFVLARSWRERYGVEYPGDSYAIIEAAAWLGIYLLTNLQLSSWLSRPDGRTSFYWATYIATWIVPAIGLWMAIRDRHRLLLDASIVMAIATLMTNKAYLGAQRQPYDPIAFGVLLIAVALGVRRWLASGADGSRRGYIAERLLDSEKERLGVVGTLSVVHQGSVASSAQPPEPPAPGGGGRSGGAGASGNF